MQKRKHIVIMALSLSLALSFVGNTWANEKVIELKFTHQNPPQATTTKLFLDPYMRQIEEATSDRVKIVSYPAQSLAAANQNFTAIEGGIADMGWVQLSYHTGRFPLTEVMGLPFIGLPSAADNSVVLQQLYEQTPAIQKHFSTVKVLFLHCTEPYMLLTKKPVQTMEDLKGMKIRTLGAIPAKMWVSLGAVPLFLTMPETYEAAEKGVISGAHLAWATTSVTRAGEVLPYWTNFGTTIDVFAVLMNLDTWNELPKDVQEQIMSVSGQKGAYFAGDSAWGPGIKDMVYESLEKNGYKFQQVDLLPGELEKMQAAAKDPLWEEWVLGMEKKKLPGREVLNKTLELLDARRALAATAEEGK